LERIDADVFTLKAPLFLRITVCGFSFPPDMLQFPSGGTYEKDHGFDGGPAGGNPYFGDFMR
jgi:hypothetical protein